MSADKGIIDLIHVDKQLFVLNCIISGCEHGTLAVFASGGENALCDTLGSRVRYRERGRGEVKNASRTNLPENHKKRAGFSKDQTLLGY